MNAVELNYIISKCANTETSALDKWKDIAYIVIDNDRKIAGFQEKIENKTLGYINSAIQPESGAKIPLCGFLFTESIPWNIIGMTPMVQEVGQQLVGGDKQYLTYISCENVQGVSFINGNKVTDVQKFIADNFPT